MKIDLYRLGALHHTGEGSTVVLPRGKVLEFLRACDSANVVWQSGVAPSEFDPLEAHWGNSPWFVIDFWGTSPGGGYSSYDAYMTYGARDVQPEINGVTVFGYEDLLIPEEEMDVSFLEGVV